MSTTYHTYDTHPAAEIFPMMEDKHIKELADDIRINGLREPITTFGGKVLDGRNRIKACEIADVEPEFVELPPDESPARYVWSKNLSRRHLSASQRSMAVFALQEILAKEAKSRMSRGGKLSVRQGVEIIPPAEQGRTRDKLAEIAHVNPRYISDAKAIQEKSPELASKVAAGEMKIPEAMRKLQGGKETKNDETASVPTSIDATLLVVDLAIGSEDRHRRKDILRAVVAESFAWQTGKSPAVIAIKEHYREGVVQSYLPSRGAARLDSSWTELEVRTRLISCQAFALRCRRVKPKSVLAEHNCKSHATSLETEIEKAIQRLIPKDETDIPGIEYIQDAVGPISANGATCATG